MTNKSDDYRKKYWGIGSIAGVLTLASSALAIPCFGEKFDPRNPVKIAQTIVLSLWIILPPIWFFFEFYWYEPTPQRDFGSFKYGQELCSKIWLALVTMLLGLYFGKDIVR